MNLSLKPGPVLAIWLPGFVLTTFVILSLQNWDLIGLVADAETRIGGTFWIAVVVMAIAFVVGQFLDAVRDVLFENLVFDHLCGKVKWEFFFEAKKESLENLEDWFYTWYEMDANIFVAIVVAAILGLFSLIPINLMTWIFMAIAAVFFFWDAKELRDSTKEMIDRYYK